MLVSLRNLVAVRRGVRCSPDAVTRPFGSRVRTHPDSRLRAAWIHARLGCMGDRPRDIPAHEEPDESNSPVAAFAAELRDLRRRAGSPSFRELAKRTHYSSSTLAEAVAGKRLPTEGVVKAFVAECGGEVDEWIARLREVSDAVRRRGTPTAAEAVVVSSDAGSRGLWSRRTIVGLGAVVGALVVGGVVGAMITATVQGERTVVAVTVPAPFSSVPTAVPSGRVPDGVDPAVAGCGSDAVLVDRSPVLIDGTQMGALDLAYSQHCQAGWARLFLYPGQPTMMGLVTVRANDGRASSIAEPLIKQVDNYTDVLVPGTSGCIGAQAVVLETGHPAVTATVMCQQPRATSPPLK